MIIVCKKLIKKLSKKLKSISENANVEATTVVVVLPITGKLLIKNLKTYIIMTVFTSTEMILSTKIKKIKKFVMCIIIIIKNILFFIRLNELKKDFIF